MPSLANFHSTENSEEPVFAGGGTMTEALMGNPNHTVTAGLELEPDYADEWQGKHPEALLMQADLQVVRTPSCGGCAS